MADTGPDDDEELKKDDGRGFSDFTRKAASALGMSVFVVIVVLLIWQMITLILVLFLGILFAIFLRGLTNHLCKRTKLGENWSFFAVTTTLVAVFGVVGWLLAPEVSNQAAQIAQKIPEALGELRQWLQESTMGARILAEVDDLELDSLVSGEFLGPLGGALFGFAGAISHAVFVVFVGIYLALDPGVYKRGTVRMVPLHYRERAEEVLDVCAHQLAWWLIGRLLAMLGVAVIITIGLWILGVPLPIFLGLVAGMLSFVPILGPIISAIPAALVAFLVGPEYVLWVILLFFFAQGIESYFITPIVQQRVVSLPHAMTLIAEIFAGILFGIIGITVATPLAVLLMALINMIYIEDVLGDTTPFRQLAADYHSSHHGEPDAEGAT